MVFKKSMLLAIALGSLVLSGCSQPSFNTDAVRNAVTEDAEKIDARVDVTLNQLYAQYPNVRDLSSRAAGILVIPLVTEAGFFWGGGYGRGALRVNGQTQDYYSTASAGYGFQFGAQQYSHALFFMTEQSLEDFRISPGWALSGDAEYTLLSGGESLRAETTTALAPVIAVVFGQSGLKFGVSIEGQKYTRIIP